MKKLIAVIALSGALASCGGGETKEATTDTSSKMAADTSAKMMDTTKKMMDTTMKMGADTTKK